MKKLKVILSKSTGYTYLEAKVVKEHINALEIAIEELKLSAQLDSDSINTLMLATRKRMEALEKRMEEFQQQLMTHNHTRFAGGAGGNYNQSV